MRKYGATEDWDRKKFQTKEKCVNIIETANNILDMVERQIIGFM